MSAPLTAVSHDCVHFDVIVRTCICICISVMKRKRLVIDSFADIPHLAAVQRLSLSAYAYSYMDSCTLRVACSLPTHTPPPDISPIKREVRARTKNPYGFLALSTHLLNVAASISVVFSHLPAATRVGRSGPLPAAASCACVHSSNHTDTEVSETGWKIC